jgi:hypothetical protein
MWAVFSLPGNPGLSEMVCGEEVIDLLTQFYFYAILRSMLTL